MEGLEMNTAFWAGKRVLLTGHTGFKGAWLATWLSEMGAKVTGFALKPPTEPSLFEVASVGSRVSSVIGDVRDPNAVTEVVRRSRPEIVIHMAAQPLVRYSYANPVETYHTNVLGTVHLLDALRRYPTARAIVNVTSDKCYENREWVWGYREDEAMGGYDPYSNSKGCSELVTSAFRQSYFNPEDYQEHGVALGSGRAGNVIGGGDWAADRLIPDFLRAIGDGVAVKIRSPYAIRPWQHVLEPLSGYLTLAERLFCDGANYAQAWNFGPADVDARPVEWIVERLTTLWGDGARWELDGTPQPHEAHYLKLDCSKARMQLGWTPRWSLDEALRRIVDWQKAYLAGANMCAVTTKQIIDYTNSSGQEIAQ